MYVGIKRNQLYVDLQAYGHWMVELETIIALASMTYIVDLHAYELHPGDENFVNKFINEC